MIQSWLLCVKYLQWWVKYTLPMYFSHNMRDILEKYDTEFVGEATKTGGQHAAVASSYYVSDSA